MESKHVLKADLRPFDACWRGIKNFEFRKNDRNFVAGDTIAIREHDAATGLYTGRELIGDITYVARGPDYGIPEGYAVLSCDWTHRADTNHPAWVLPITRPRVSHD